MLPKHNNKIDFDGYSTLLLSTVVMFTTAGLSYLHCFRKIFHVANNETHQCDNDVVIFVLGKKLINNEPDDEYLQRLQRVHHLLINDNRSQVVILGGKTGSAIITEAHAGKLFLEKHNIERSRIKVEEKSRNTLENIKNAISLLLLEKKKIVIVTNRYHLARAKQMASGFGLEVDLCAAEEKLKINFSSVFKIIIEALHIHWYVSGRFYARLTNNIRMIERVGKY